MSFIILGPDEHRVNDDACRALQNDPTIYVRGGHLVRVLDSETNSFGSRGAKILQITAPTLRERLTWCADWVRVDDEGEQKLSVPTKQCVDAVLARGEWPGLRRLIALAECPVLLPNGEIIETPGYHSDETGIYYAPRHHVELNVLSHPTQEDAKRAVDCLFEAIDQFPFDKPHHRSAWLAGLLTPLARHAFSGLTPLFLLTANSPGSGKGMLVNLISIIVRGEVLATNSMPDNSEELRKQITTILLSGTQMVNFDDLGGSLGGNDLNRLLTSEWWSDRLLGHNKDAMLPNCTVWFGTGNNVGVQGDTQRRVCPIRLESPYERPEERADIRIPELLLWARDKRSQLLSASLTILKGYIMAGRPKMSLLDWGSYEGWSSLVRASIVWAGQPDPARGREVVRDHGDDRLMAIREILARWDEIDPLNIGITGTKIIEAIDDLSRENEIGELLSMLVGPRPKNGHEDKRPKLLGVAFKGFRGRVFNGRMLTQKGTGKGGAVKWCCASADEGGSGDPSDPVAAQIHNGDFSSITVPAGSGSPDPPDPPSGRLFTMLSVESRLNSWNQSISDDDSRQTK